jgi:hypothetical protein
VFPISDIKSKYSTAEVAITVTLNSLANGAARECTAVDNTTNLYLSAKVRVAVTTNATAPSGTKTVDVYAYGSCGTYYPDNCTGSDALVTLVSPTNLVFMGSINCPSASTLYDRVFDMGIAFPGGLPSKWGIVCVNSTGNALNSSGCSAAYQGVLTQIV